MKNNKILEMIMHKTNDNVLVERLKSGLLILLPDSLRIRKNNDKNIRIYDFNSESLKKIRKSELVLFLNEKHEITIIKSRYIFKNCK